MELELDERSELDDESELLLELDGRFKLDDELEITKDDWLDLDEAGTELWLDGVVVAR